jgi:uncharacterized membrane protein
MRTRTLFLAIAVAALAGAAQAQTATQPPPRGLWLITDYPSTSVRPGETATIRLKIQNSGLPPERVELALKGLPDNWKAELVGGGQQVRAAMPATNDSVSLELRLTVPAEQAAGTRTITVEAKGKDINASLPLDVMLGVGQPAKLELKPKLPSLRGTVKSSFDFEFSVKNDSGKNATVSLAGRTPPNVQASFTEGYGSQEISSIPIDAGQSKDLKFKVKLPSDAQAGNYQVAVQASADGATAQMPLSLEATGAPKLRVSSKDERLSASAEAGATSQIELVISNDGSAPAESVELSSTPPSGWKVDFDAKTIERIAPNEKKSVMANVTPSAKAIAGDYMTAIKAAAGGESASADFRIAVTTSTLWGVFGIGIIAIALLVLVGAVFRFGRR